MQLTSTTDYAIRIVCYLAAQRQMISTSELSQELSVPSSYIPKITKKLKQAGIIKACEGIKGGYQIAKQPENISLRDVISCTESTMAISRCLEKEGGCSKNYIACCKVHQILLDLQNIYNNRLESVKISDIIRPGKDEYLGKFYVIIKVNLREKDYECIYSHNHDDFIKKYAEKYICEADWVNVQKCLAGENLTEHLVDGCVEEEIFYRGIIENNDTSYVWMKATDIGNDDNNGFNFTNTYVQEAGTGTDPVNPGPDYTTYGSLDVSKIIKTDAADTADTNKEFEFTADFTFPNGTDVTTLGAKATIGDSTTSITGTSHTFKLKHGQNVKFTGLPVGTKISVTESATPNYKGSAEVVINNGPKEAVAETKYNEALTVSNKTLGQNKNTVDVTNTYNYVPTTGIIMNTLPYVLMIALCGAALMAFVAFKRRRLQK